MAEAVAEAFGEEQHLLVQAGTGTGKSLAYLVPALLHEGRVVVATATLALQHQLVERDLPRLIEAVGSMPGGGEVDTSFAVQKGRSNYACLHRIREGVPDDQGTLVDVPMGPMATKVLELRTWAEPGGRGRRHRRARPRAAAHRPRVAAGERQPPRLPRRRPLPVRRRVLRRARPREGAPLAPGGHQPLAARDRRHRGRADAAGLRRRRRRRGARAGRPGHPGRHRRALARRRRAGGPPLAAPRRGRPGRRPRRRERRAAPGGGRGEAGTLRPAAAGARRRPRARPRRRPRLRLRLPEVRQERHERARRRPAAGQGVGAGGVRHRRADGGGLDATTSSGSPRAPTGSRRGCAWRRSRCGGRCGRSCSPTRPS